MYAKTYRGGQYDGTSPPKKTKDTKKGAKGAKGAKKDVIRPTKVKRYGCKNKEPRHVTERNLLPEKVKQKLKEKQDKKPDFRTTASTIGAFIGLLEDATEEEIKGDQHIESIDFQILSNAKLHHTDRFKCVKRSENPDLVLRRGSSFKICLNLGLEYDKEDHNVTFTFKAGADDDTDTTGTQFDFEMDEDEQDDDAKNHRKWHAQLKSINGKSIEVEITIPPTVVIGHWRMSIETFSIHKGKDNIALEYNSEQDIIILLNPWCPEDDSYLATEELVEKYVLQDKGAVYQGNYRQITQKPWTFGQYEEGILDACLMILFKAFDFEINKKMGDVVQISRAITRIVNSNDDDGVLVGNWSGEYSDGVSPSKWVGSVKILKQYAETRLPVQYGQCWVFSALVVTVCRALGLPCRSITNFASAHDTNASATIDTVYFENDDGELEKDEHESDSCWNFHVWNEVWMARKDLPPGYDGWQAIDATPQELSEGRFACGPAPLAAIKSGDCIIKYDTLFIFSEVNADRITWQKGKKSEPWKKLRVQRYNVGRNISTLDPSSQPNNLQRLDVTSSYKHPEGSKREREAVARAVSCSNVKRRVDEDISQDVDIDIKDIDEVMIGKDFEVRIKVKNIAESKEPRSMKKIVATVYTVKYTGEFDKFVKRMEFKGFTLEPNQVEVLKFVVTAEEYEPKMKSDEQQAFEVKAFGTCVETGRSIVEREDFMVKHPEVEVKIGPEECEVNQQMSVDMYLKNPLSVPLTNCSYTIDSEALGLHEETIEWQGEVPANGEWKVHLDKTVWECPFFGYEAINVSFQSNELITETGVSNGIKII